MDMNLGNLMIHKSRNQDLLIIQLQVTPDLGVQPFTNRGSPVNLPVNKRFQRKRAVGFQ